MDDKDVRRLDDKIDAVGRETQLRIETVLARIDGKLDGLNQTYAALRGEVAESRSVARTWQQLTLASVLVLAGTIIALKQVWIGGVQVGQASVQASQPAQVTPTRPAPPDPAK